MCKLLAIGNCQKVHIWVDFCQDHLQSEVVSKIVEPVWWQLTVIFNGNLSKYLTEYPTRKMNHDNKNLLDIIKMILVNSLRNLRIINSFQIYNCSFWIMQKWLNEIGYLFIEILAFSICLYTLGMCLLRRYEWEIFFLFTGNYHWICCPSTSFQSTWLTRRMGMWSYWPMDTGEAIRSYWSVKARLLMSAR